MSICHVTCYVHPLLSQTCVRCSAHGCSFVRLHFTIWYLYTWESVLCDLTCHLLSLCRTISECRLNLNDGEGFCKTLWEEGHADINAWPGCSRQNKYPFTACRVCSDCVATKVGRFVSIKLHLVTYSRTTCVCCSPGYQDSIITGG